MIVYDKFGYQIKRFEKEDGIELFKYFIEYRVLSKKNNNEYSNQRRKLKLQIREALNSKYHTPLGIYKDDKLIGVCLSNIYADQPEIPKLTYFHVDSKCDQSMYILFNFLINILYKDMHIQIKNNYLNEYGSIVRKMPSLIGFSVFNENFKNNLQKYFKD